MNICDEVLNLCEVHNPFEVKSLKGRSLLDVEHYIRMDGIRIGSLVPENLGNNKRVKWTVILVPEDQGGIKATSKEMAQIKKVVKDWLKFTGKTDTPVTIIK